MNKINHHDLKLKFNYIVPMKKIYILVFSLLFSVYSFAQVQIGKDIDGEAADDHSGRSISLSSDGSVIAIGATGNDGNGADAGHVRIYQNKSGTWTQVGKDIDGEAVDDYSGNSVSLSSNGSIVAIGATGNDGNGTNAGHVRIYQNKSGTWTQVGKDINGEAKSDLSGSSVSLSADGKRVAIGAPWNNGTLYATGQVRIYEWSGSQWTQLGTDIDGLAQTYIGSAVSLSADGKRVAIGTEIVHENGSRSGQTRIFEWSGSKWLQMGWRINGEAAKDRSGCSVSLSSDGSIVAIGAYLNDGYRLDAGHTRIFGWSGSAWVQLGADIDGAASDDNSGYSVSLSADGKRVAIGAPFPYGPSAGHTRIYDWSGSQWTQLGTSIAGEAAGDKSGSVVFLSADGKRLAIGSNLNSGNGSGSGHVKVYNLECAHLSITANPIDVTLSIGKTAILRLESNYKLHQWQIDTGSGYKNITNTGQFDGADTDSLSILSLALSNNNQNFRCIVNTDGCIDTSEVAILTVECELDPITANPKDVTILIGKTAIMELESNYKSYQWQTDTGTGFEYILNTGQFDGALTDSLSIMSLTPSNNNQNFRCIVNTGGCTDTSEVAKLTVDGNVGINDTKRAFSIYPNPTKDVLNITVVNKLIGSSFTVTDLLGKEVLKGEINNTSSTIDVSVISKGYYLLQIGDGTVSQKILVE